MIETFNTLDVDDNFFDEVEEVVETNEDSASTEDIDTIEEETVETEEDESEEGTESEEDSEEEGVEESEETVAEIWANQLIEGGIIPEMDEESRAEFKSLDEETQVTKLVEINNKAILTRGEELLNEYLAERPNRIRLIDENYKAGMDEEKAIKFALDAPDIYNPVTEDQVDTNLEKSILKQYYVSKIGDADAAEAIISKHETEGLLTEKAREVSEKNKEMWTQAREQELKNIELSNKQAQEQYIKKQNGFKEFLNKTEELIPGIKLSKKDKDSIYSAMYDTVPTKNGATTALNMKLAENPEQAEALINYLLVTLDVLDNPNNYNKIFKVGKTIQTKSVLSKAKNSATLTNKRPQSKPSKVDMNDLTFF